MILARSVTMGGETKDLVSFHNLGPSALPSWGWERAWARAWALADHADLFQEGSQQLLGWKPHPRRGWADEGWMKASSCHPGAVIGTLVSMFIQTGVLAFGGSSVFSRWI